MLRSETVTGALWALAIVIEQYVFIVRDDPYFFAIA